MRTVTKYLESPIYVQGYVDHWDKRQDQYAIVFDGKGLNLVCLIYSSVSNFRALELSVGDKVVVNGLATIDWNLLSNNDLLISPCEVSKDQILTDAGADETDEADVNIGDVLGENTQLHEAVEDGELELVRFLIDAGADVNALDKWLDTPLIIAAEEGDLEIVQILVDAGADVNVQDRWLDTPLHIATEEGDLEIVQILVDAGADVNVQDRWGDTPLQIAMEEGDTEIMRVIMAKYVATPEPTATPLVKKVNGLGAIIPNPAFSQAQMVTSGAYVNLT